MSLRYVAVPLRLGNLATQEEIAQAFGQSVATQRRWETRFLTQGFEGLQRGRSTGRPSSLPKAVDSVLRKWFKERVWNREMAKRLGVSEPTIGRALARLGLKRQVPGRELLWPVDPAEETPSAEDHKDCQTEAAKAEENGAPAEEATPLEEDRSTTDENHHPEVYVEARSSHSSSDSSDALERQSSKESSRKTTTEQKLCGATTHVVDEPILAESEMESESAGTPLPRFGEPLEKVLAILEEKGFSVDWDPDDRSGDRALARLGLLEDATPLFADRPAVRQAGVLLAIPLLVRSKLLEVFLAVYCSLGPAFYGLRTFVVVLFVAALLRIKRPEHFKEHNPQGLGHVLGLDRVPEVNLSKTKKSQDQVAKPAATDHWVHDAKGEPLLVVTSELNESLTQMLEPILKDVEILMGERWVTVVFDRGGYCPKLFVRLDRLGFEVMTYRKGWSSNVDSDHER